MKYILSAILCLAVITACASGPTRDTSKKSAAHPMKTKSSTPMRSNTGKTECYKMGYRWGVCTAENTAGLNCNPETDAAIPAECRNHPEALQGIKDGLRATQMRLQQ